MKLEFKAAVLFKQKKKLEIINIEFNNKLKRGQIAVKLKYSGVCGSQIGEIEGIKGKDKYLPHLLGHEASGIVIEKHESVKSVKKNDHVVLHWMKSNKIQSETPIYYNNNKKINAGSVTTFNQLAIVSENRLTKIPKFINLKHACLLGCSLTTAFGTILNYDYINPEDNVLIIGCGAIGLPLITALKTNKNKLVIAIDINKKNLNLAKKMGADKIYLSKKNEESSLKKIINRFKVNKIIDTTGNSKIIENAYNLLETKGNLVLLGVPNHKEKIAINTLGINLGKKIVGSHGGGIEPSKDILKIYNLAKNKFKFKNYISNIISLSQINKYIGLIKKRKISGKVIIKF